MLNLLIASSNPGKIKEIKTLLSDIPVSLVTIPDLGLRVKIQENGSTYAENAGIKALKYAKLTGLVVLADDSGLEVAVLNGLPGIRSARFSPLANATDANRRAYLLEQVRSFPEPWEARFVCSIALAVSGGQLIYSYGDCKGEIIPIERGNNGFGYDPIFLLPKLNKTMAELPIDVKNKLSHRGKAINLIKPNLLELIAETEM